MQSHTELILNNIIFLENLLDQESAAQVSHIPFLELAKHIRVNPLPQGEDPQAGNFRREP